MKPSASRSARIFLSSAFRDFGEERDLLVRKVFPALRARLKDRFVELVDVDLRWGITAEHAGRGAADLPRRDRQVEAVLRGTAEGA
jgi:hypothetical protein